MGEEACAFGGGAIKIRLENGQSRDGTVEAELHGWKTGSYPTKAETDANFRRMLDFGCRPENAKAVRLGVASHNLFDVASLLCCETRTESANKSKLKCWKEWLIIRLEPYVMRGRVFCFTLRRFSGTIFRVLWPILSVDSMKTRHRRISFVKCLQCGPVRRNGASQKVRFVRGWTERNTVSSESRRACNHRSSLSAVPGSEGPKTKDEILMRFSLCSNPLPLSEDGATGSKSLYAFENTADSDWTQFSVRAELEKAIEEWRPETLPELAETRNMLEAPEQHSLHGEAKGWEYREKILIALPSL